MNRDCKELISLSMKETDLYAPVKAFLESQGYQVKAEVQDCDVVALRGEDPPVIVELKLTLSLALLMQGIARQGVTDAVYVAVPAGKGKAWRGRLKDSTRLCRRLGLGLITVRLHDGSGVLVVHADPGPYKPHKLARRSTSLLREFQRRVGDPNTGGQTRTAIVTAYRQDSLRVALALIDGQCKPALIKAALNIPQAPSILQKNYYGWFVRESRGVYCISAAGKDALVTYADVVRLLKTQGGIGVAKNATPEDTEKHAASN